MTQQRRPMTHHAEVKLRAELERLKTQERPKVIAEIAEARAHGDLKENAEYHAAREKQGFIEGRIQYLESRLSQPQIINITKIPNTGKVIFGTTVLLLNPDTEEAIEYQIVCEDEADLVLKKISITSPIARGLIGKSVGDEVSISTPNGMVYYEVLEVHHR